ncbi:MAG: class F sortase, partial [Haloechinothrix sp.]
LGAAPVEVQVGDENAQTLGFGLATGFVRLAPGTEVQIARTPLPLAHASPGCMDTILLMAPPPAGRGPIEVPECAPERVDPGMASIRFINATPDSGSVLLDTGTPDAGVIDHYNADARRAAPAGVLAVRVRSPAGEPLGERIVELTPNTGYTAIWAGSGETPLQLLWLEDGQQPGDPPPPELPIDTDSPATDPVRPHVRLGAAAGVALVVLGRLRRLGRRVVPAVLLILVSACAADSQSPGAAPTAPPRPTAPTSRPVGDAPVAEPVRLSIPTIGIAAPVTPVAADAGTELPDTLPGDQVAWFRGTNPPGVQGVAVLAGHVVWNLGPGIFANLDQLTPGTTIEVTDNAGTPRSFTVRGQATVPKGNLDPSWFAFSPEPRLVLVTCTGAIDRDRGLRSDNLLVLASATQAPRVVDAR